MTFEALEQSEFAGAPAEFYLFTMGSAVWRLTSSDAERTVADPGVNLYTSAPISRTETQFDQEDSAGDIAVTLPRDHEIAQLFNTSAPVAPLTLTIRALHRSDAVLGTIIQFVGEVTSCQFDGAFAKLTCANVFGKLRILVPRLVMAPRCNWALFGEGCGLNKADYVEAATVTAVSGRDVTSTTFSGHADGHYINGWIERTNGQRQMIVGHVGDTVTVQIPFPDLAVSEVVSAYPGCEHTEADCGTKFNNLVNHLGWPRIPGRNPYTNGVI